MQYPNFHQAYLSNLRSVYTQPDFINSPRQYLSREKLNVNIIITNPLERICYLAERKTNIVFNFAEALWYLSGSHDLEYIDYYAPHFKNYVNHQKELIGSAYGPKIFHYGIQKIDQWQRAFQILNEEDSSSKRAFVQIFDPSENLSLSNPDVSCTIGLHFLLRNNKLYLTSFMRANDAYRGIVSDIFSFTFLQEIMARQLNVELGSYSQMTSSMHIYENDANLIEKVLVNKESDNDCRFTFPTMPMGNPWPHLNTVIEFERYIRKDKISFNDMPGTLPEYWRQILLLFVCYRNIHDQKSILISAYDQLWPIYQYLLTNRWKDK
jgi:thymidylate synthase